MEPIAEFAGLSPDFMVQILLVALAAGLVRGFTGFGLSAIVMAALSPIIAPIELVPICFGLEVVASIIMGRSGAQNADWTIVRGLVIGSLIGVPLGLLILTRIDADLSRSLALIVILSLTTLILLNVKARFLATRFGLYMSGLSAGTVTGLAGVGGLVVALYVLARDKQVAAMRASLVTFLMISEISTALYYIVYQILTFDVARRVVIMAPMIVLGIWIGTKLFNPKFERYYKPVCLIILICLCVNGLART